MPKRWQQAFRIGTKTYFAALLIVAQGASSNGDHSDVGHVHSDQAGFHAHYFSDSWLAVEADNPTVGVFPPLLLIPRQASSTPKPFRIRLEGSQSRAPPCLSLRTPIV